MNSTNNLFDKIKIKLWKNTELVRPVGWSTKQEIIKLDTVFSILDEAKEEFATDTNVGNNSWIPCSERLPEDGTYLCTLDGELCGLDEPFTGMCGIENGVWDEPDCVIAWQPLPEQYQPKE